MPKKGLDSENNVHKKRQAQIVQAAVDLIGRYGFYGTSLQQISDAVGLTNAGVLYYVKNKDGLLTLVLESYYDKSNKAWAYLREHSEESRSITNPALLPDLYRCIAQTNEARPDMVRLFSVLDAEALQSDHPAYEYFKRREELFEKHVSAVRWSLPEGASFHKTFRAANSMMDGLQLRWLRSEKKSLISMWEECSQVIFPYPLWEGFGSNRPRR